jgi:hypothetical protein
LYISLFLAKALGLYFSIVGAAMLVNARNIKPAIVAYMNAPAVTFLGGFMALIIGILIVLVHNIWTFDWRGVITILGWTSILKGVIWGLFPQWISTKEKNLMLKPTSYNLAAFLTLFIGVFLLYIAHMHNSF